MATTTNFGWETPDDTDLVKDGAAAIRTALGGVDTSFVDLKGGTTGQVLAKASNTDLDYTWVAVDPLTILDAKGDLISATAADTPARLAVGSNNQVLTADSSTATGLKWATISTSPTFVGCAIWTTANTAWTQNVQATIAFPNETFDSNGFHSNTTNNSRITIPTGYGGKYLLTVNTLTPDDWNGYGYTFLWKNGAVATDAEGLYNDGRFGSVAATAGVNQLNASTTITCNAGDYLELRIQSAWTTANHTLYSRFTATWLGA